MPSYDFIIQKFVNFRKSLFDMLHFRADATMDFIDALAAGGDQRKSMVEISLGSIFRQCYVSITNVVKNLFVTNRKKFSKKERYNEQKHFRNLLTRQIPEPIQRKYPLCVVDCVPQSRIYAHKLPDRSYVHAPNHVPGQKPITIGHQFSIAAYLPETHVAQSSHWIQPIDVQRIKSDDNSTMIGMQQLKEIADQICLSGQLFVDVADCAYSSLDCIKVVPPHSVHIARLRGNRILYHALKPINIKKSKGRPKSYGEQFSLHSPSKSDEDALFEFQTKRGKQCTAKIERWHDLLIRGKKGALYPVDVVRIVVFDKDGNLIYSKPLWIVVAGNRRKELTLIEIYENYRQRFDVEHYLRFSKQNLMAVSTQTCIVEHEENYWWLSVFAYTMLFLTKELAHILPRPWEKKRATLPSTPLSPSYVQRDYERISKEIGTPAFSPKRRGKSPGRPRGRLGVCRPKQPVIKKHKENKRVTSSPISFPSSNVQRDHKRIIQETGTPALSPKRQQKSLKRLRAHQPKQPIIKKRKKIRLNC